MTHRRTIPLFLMLALALGLVGTAQEPKPTRQALEKQAVEAIARGEDASALIAQALALPKGDRSIEARRQAKDRTPDDKLVGEDFDAVAARLDALGIEDAEILDRLELAKAAHASRADEKSLDGTPADLVTRAEPIILRSTLLPYRPASLPPRAPRLQPAITPAYLDPTDPGELPADLESSPEAPLSQAILAKAAELEYRYTAIYEFVRNEIELEWSGAALRGAEGALLAGRGSAADQAALLVALLRSSSAAARFVHGTIELDAARLRSDLGLASTNQVATFLARSGVPYAPVVRGGQIAAFQVEHVWVAARVPYTNYRGAIVDTSGRTWIPLDPYLVRNDVTSSTGILDELGLDAGSFRDDYLSGATDELPTERLRDAVNQHLIDTGRPTETFDEQLAQHRPRSEKLGHLPSTTPYQVVATVGESSSLPEALRASARFVMRSAAGAVQLDHTVALSAVAGHRVTLTYIPATVEDHRLVLGFGGLGRVPAYLVAVRPQLKIDGRVVATGEPLPLATAHQLSVELAGPWGMEQTSQTLYSGSYVALAVGGPTASRQLDLGDNPADTEGLAARLLSRVAYDLAARWDDGERLLARAMDVVVARPVPTLVMAIDAIQITQLAGVPIDIDWQGVQLDAALRMNDGIGSRAQDWRTLAALEGSALEHGVLQDVLQVNSISTAKGLGLARDRGVDVVTVDATTSLQHPSNVVADVMASVAAGHIVEIPRTTLDVDDWSGSMWRVEDPTTGAEGYFLAGGLRGGATAITPSNWPLGELAAALGDPFAEAPNEDPLAGERVEVLYFLDDQSGEVGTYYDQPIGVRVLDRIGRPVLGARVTFQTTIGRLGRQGVDGPPATTKVVLTNQLGEALVSLEAGKVTDADPVLRRRNPIDTFRSQALRQRVQVSVVSANGILEPPQPIRATAFPGAVTTFERTDEPALDGLLGLYSDRMDYYFGDRYGNPVANAEVTVFAGAIDRGLHQNIDIGGGDTVSCPVDDSPNNLTFFDARLDSTGSVPGCPDRPAVGDCGRVLQVVESGSDGTASVGVILGDSLVGWNADVRRSVPGDSTCRDLLPEGDAQADAESVCAQVYGGPTVSEQGIELTYLYSTRISIQQIANPNIPVCSPLPNSLRVADNLGRNPATGTFERLGHPVKIAFYSLMAADCAPRGIPWCDPTRPDAEECTIECPIQGEPCAVCNRIESGTPCRDFGPTGCLDNLLCDWESALPRCDFERWSWVKLDMEHEQTTVSMVDPASVAESSSIDSAGVAGMLAEPLATPPMSQPVTKGTPLGQVSAALPVDDGSIQVFVDGHSSPAEGELRIDTRTWDRVWSTSLDGQIKLDSYRTFLGLAWPQFRQSYENLPMGTVWTVAPTVVSVEPEVLPLSDDGVLLTDVVVRYSLPPTGYDAERVEVRLLEGTERIIDSEIGSSTFGQGVAVFARGRQLEPQAVYDVQVVINPGNIYEVEGERVPVPTDRQLVRSFTPSLRVEQQVDLVNPMSCGTGGVYRFQLNEDADVRLDALPIEGVDVLTGEPQLGTPRNLFSGFYSAQTEPGVYAEHLEQIDVDDLAPGDYRLRLTATRGGQQDVRLGQAISQVTVTDKLPLAHTLVKGVDLWNGTLSVNRSDFAIPGRGATLDFMRTYNSAGAESQGPLGLGWGHNWQSELRKTGCGEVVISGGEGSGMRFRFTEDDAEGQTELEPLNGYRGSLVYNADLGSFAYYTLAGMRYDYEPSATEGSWLLTSVVDPSDNRLNLDYAPSVFGPQLIRVTDASGREINFDYQQREFIGWQGSVIDSVTAPGGLGVSFTYDAYGHLETATRADGLRDERYEYSPVSQWNYQARQTLTSIHDDRTGSVTRYAYEVVDQSAGSDLRQTLTVVSVEEAASSVSTLFDYDEAALSNGGSSTTVVTDRRGETTTYEFNEYGGVTTITDPLGHVSLTEWVPNDVLPSRVRDANGVWTTYTYDEHTNVLTETIGEYVMTMTYAPPESFDPPYIKNRMATKVDRDGDLTTLGYDTRGLLTTETYDLGSTDGEDFGDIEVSHTYDTRGDMRTTTDGRGNVTQYRYDDYGYQTQRIDPLLHVTQQQWDVRGRLERRVDPRGNQMLFGYDGLDRLTTQQFANGDLETTEYLDETFERRRVDGEGRVTVTTFDREGRILEIKNAAGGTKLFAYDPMGNKLSESLWFDDDTARHDISYEYDAAGRLERRIEPLGRVTVYAQDKVGNPLSETLLDTSDPSFEPRVTSWPEYDALNRPTREEQRLVDPISAEMRSLTTVFEWNGDGEKLREVDPLGRVTTWEYDGLNRLVRLSQGDGLSITHRRYDDNGNLLSEQLENPLGSGDQVRSFVYDAANRLTTETDAEGHSASYEHDEADNVTREIDRRGAVTEHDYDERNRRTVTRLKLERGRDETAIARMAYSFDAVGNVIAEEQANGNVVTTVYDDLDRPTAVSDSVGAIASFTYDARSNRTSETDGEGHTTVATFDALDRPTRLEMPEDRTVERTFDAAGNPVAEKNPRGDVTSFEYDTLDRLVRITDPAPFRYQLTADYDDADNVVAVTNRRGFTTDLEYDALNRPVKRLSPPVAGERYEVTTSFDAAGNVLETVDPRGFATSLAYDLENRRISTVRAGLTLETVEYDAGGLVRFVSDARQFKTGFEYDERGLVLAINQPESASTHFAYDLIGNRLETQDPEQKVRKWTYDERRRVEAEQLEVEAGRFAATRYEYDLRNLRTAAIRPKGSRWDWSFDGARRLEEVDVPSSGTTAYGYDKNNNLITQVDAEDKTTSFDYDQLNRRTQRTYPDQSTETWTFDENGNVATRTDPMQRVTSFVYDALDRAATSDVPLRADAALSDQLEQLNWSWDKNNNLRQVDEHYTQSGVHTTARTYDAFDRLETITDRFDRRITYGYDATGNRTSLSAPDQQTTYTYDGLNRVATVLNASGVTEYDYLKNSQMRGVEYPNGTKAAYSYDTANRLEAIVHSQGQAEISSYLYAYDDHSNRVEQTEAQIGRDTEVTSYIYDPADRLETVVYPEKTVSYGYDNVGNRETETIQLAGGGEPEIKAYQYDDRHQLEAITHALDPTNDVVYTYDPNGNQTRKTKNGLATDFVFDALDRLTRIEEGGLPQGFYTFDYQGLRIQKQAEGRQVQYLYDDQSVLQRHDSQAGQVTYDYGPDSLLSANHPAEGRSFYLFDGLGSVVGMTTPGGSLRAQYSYDAWGNYRHQIGAESNVFGFTGHEMDSESGLIYARARFYDPDVGRFLSEDPAADDFSNPPSLHKYAYAFQNPTVYTDPTGEVEEVKQVSGFFKGGGVGAVVDLAGDIEDEFGKAAGIGVGVLGFAPGIFNSAVGFGLDLVNFGLNLTLQTALPSSELGREATAELNDLALLAVESGESLYEDAKWAKENPLEAGANLVNATIDVGVKLATGDARTVTQALAIAGEVVSGGILSRLGKGKGLADAISKVIGRKNARGQARRPPRARPQPENSVSVPSKKCFVAGTLVMTLDGQRPIEEVEEDDWVWSMNEDTGELELRRVVQAFVTPDMQIWEVEIETADGSVETIETTAEHPFYVEGLGWVPTARLRVGDPLIPMNGETGLTVRQVRGSPRYEKVYNFEVEERHNYFVGESQVWVHNLCEAGKERLAQLKAERAERNRLRAAGKPIPPRNRNFATYVESERGIAAGFSGKPPKRVIYEDLFDSRGIVTFERPYGRIRAVIFEPRGRGSRFQTVGGSPRFIRQPSEIVVEPRGALKTLAQDLRGSLAEIELSRSHFERGARERVATEWPDAVAEVLTEVGLRSKGTKDKTLGDLVMDDLVRDLERRLAKKGD